MNDRPMKVIKGPLGPKTKLYAAAFDALIDKTLKGDTPIPPRAAAAELLDRLNQYGLAEVTPHGSGFAIVLCGISANSTGTEAAALRNWQSAARVRMALEVQQCL
ncbi:hypothetical protein [Cypionkella sp.]|uniref:hypothetical protein n=1 Tax=Cypionkella sp. TaxID=2811411 RepID=UPI002ABC928B|nr:hypothetical protein [Cypionkella sp.]MDZ4393792.1 hypothetical protein [Cypionkella sp.]